MDLKKSLGPGRLSLGYGISLLALLLTTHSLPSELCLLVLITENTCKGYVKASQWLGHWQRSLDSS